MFKVCLLIALAIVGACAQEAAPGETGQAEPYSYGYQTDTHAASEQRDPSGKVTGFYTLVGDDGRERRVEYYADESGFHAKVQTNEVGTESKNSADVEFLASPPTREQLIYQAQAPAQAPTPAPAPIVNQQFLVKPPVQRVASTQVVQQPARTSVQYTQQPGYGYGYSGYSQYPGYGYGYGSGYGSGYGAGYGAGYGSQYGYGASPSVGYGTYSSYNNHLPSSYYASRQVTTVAQPVAYGANSRGVSGGYVTGPATSTTYRSGYQTIGGQTTGYRSTVGSPAGPSNLGSSNYVLLQKREAKN